MAETVPVKIPLADICFDDSFRISRPAAGDALSRSLKELGMLEKPWLIDDGGRLVPLTCHNRILALRELGTAEVDSFILKQFDPGIFAGNTAIKVRRNEVGPAGKCKALLIAQKFNMYEDHGQFCKRVLNVSADILEPGFAMRVLDLPDDLKNYIDIKDTGFKIIRDLVSLPQYMIQWLDRCVASMQVRVNVFKMVVDCLFDLGKKNPHVALPVPEAAGPDDRQLLDAFSRLRFPEYSSLKEQAGSLIDAVTSRGVSVEFPEYFEGGSFRLIIDVGVRDSGDDIRARLKSIDTEKLAGLAKLLR